MGVAMERTARQTFPGSLPTSAVGDDTARSEHFNGALFAVADFQLRMPTPVLLVAEDDETDALLLERALRRAGSPFTMVRVENGEEAIAYVEGTGRYADRSRFPTPWVMLLDLRMPRKGGFEVLRWRREAPGRSSLPIVVFTSSSLAADIERAYELGANSYVIKPTSGERLESVVKALHEWWAQFNVGANPSVL
jgi:CheY-like chemotaxis protein